MYIQGTFKMSRYGSIKIIVLARKSYQLYKYLLPEFMHEMFILYFHSSLYSTSEKYQNSWSVKYSCDNKIFMMLIELPQVFVIVTLCSMYIGTLDMSKA